MKTKFIKISLLVVLAMALSACVVAPVQPLGYRMTSTSISTNTAMPTYVNGQYVGVQSGDYVAQNQTSTYVATPSPTVVYVQNPAPVYSYSPYIPYTPYYAPAYVSPWYGARIGTGIGIGIGVNSVRAGCCWSGGRRGWGGAGPRRWRR